MSVPGAAFQRVILHSAETDAVPGDAVDLIGPAGAFSEMAVQLEGINGETVTFQATIDKETWYSVLFRNVTTGGEAITATADGIYRATVAGFAQARANITVGGVGSVTATALVLA